MSESKEAVAVPLTEAEANEVFPRPEMGVYLSQGDIRGIARFISSVEVEGEAAEALAAIASKLSQVFAKRNNNFDILGFVSDCNLGDDKKCALRVAASGFAARISNNAPIAVHEALGLNNLALAAIGAKPIQEFEEDPLEEGAKGAAARFTPNQDWVYITKKDSRHANGGPYKVVDVDIVRGVVGIMVSNIRQEYKAYNLRKG